MYIKLGLRHYTSNISILYLDLGLKNYEETFFTPPLIFELGLLFSEAFPDYLIRANMLGLHDEAS